MRHLYFNLAAVASLLVFTACGAATPAPIQAPPRAVDVETRAAPSHRSRDLPPALVAPPPAYGNKIVMAKGQSSSAAF